MKKLFIGLLVIAAGATAFFLMRNKKDEPASPLKKELVVGQWKLDTLSVHPNDSTTGLVIAIIATLDSNFKKYGYDFRRDGNIIESLNDSITTDTSYYEWGKKNELLLKGSATDSIGDAFTVIKLANDSLLMQSKDSSTFLFTKLK